MDCLFWTSRRHWWEQVNSTVIEFHLSNTSGSRRVRTRIARLVDRDSNDCSISLPPTTICYRLDKYRPIHKAAVPSKVVCYVHFIEKCFRCEISLHVSLSEYAKTEQFYFIIYKRVANTVTFLSICGFLYSLTTLILRKFISIEYCSILWVSGRVKHTCIKLIYAWLTNGPLEQFSLQNDLLGSIF